MKRIFFVLVLCTLKAYPQFHAPVNRDYLTTKNYTVFPAISGLAVGGQAHLSIRNLMFTNKELANKDYLNIVGAADINFELPTAFEWSAHHRIWDRTGISFAVYNDTRNFPSISRVSTGLSRSFFFGNNIRTIRRLAIGVRMNYLALRYRIFDQTGFTFLGIDDRRLTYDIGVSFAANGFYIHSVFNNISAKRAGFYDFDSASPQFAIQAGLVRKANSIKFEPSVMFQTGFIPENSPYKPRFLPYTLDFNFKAYTYIKTNVIWGALSYRTAPGYDNNDVREIDFNETTTVDFSKIYEGSFSSVSFLLGFQTPKWMFAYTLSVQNAFDSFYKSQFSQNELLIPGVTYHQFTIGMKLSGNGMRYYENSINSASPFY